MNAMSVSPVKPPLNAGSHSVAATATNLTKTPPLPPANNFGPLNLIPEAKSTLPPPPQPPVIAASPEKSVDLCAKPPTSNGTVFPLPAEASAAAAACPLPGAANCVENSGETAENLSTNNTLPKATLAEPVPAPLPVPVEPKAAAAVVEEKKPEVAKVPANEEPAPAPAHVPAEKEVPARAETAAKDVPNNVDPVPSKEEEKEVAAKAVDSVPNNVDAKPAPAEPVPESKAEVETPKEQPSVAVADAAASAESAEAEPTVEETTKNVTPKTTKRKAAKPPAEVVEEDTADGRKSKRVRLPTQPYQSPIPELQFIAKLNIPTKTTPKNASERIIAFFKNEFLAVRNPEGSFYICQTFQNIHKSSTKIKIRWFTNLPQDVFTPDFYDTTEFDCILTNVSMTRIEKDRWKLPDHERTRIENILKRALDVEKGVVEQPSVTEEHPDGLDLSLFKDEAQLKKRKKKAASPKKKAAATGSAAAAAPAAATPSKKKPMKAAAKSTPKPSTQKKPSAPTPAKKPTSRQSAVSQSAAAAAASAAASEKAKSAADAKAAAAKKDKKKAKSSGGKGAKKAAPAASKQQSTAGDKASSKSWEPSVKASNSSRVVLSLKKEGATTTAAATAAAASTAKSTTASASAATSAEPKAATKRTSSVSQKASAAATLATPSPPQKRRKEEPKSAAAAATTTTAAAAATATPAERTGKVRNAGSAVTAKINSAAMRTTKEKERKSTTPTSAAAAAASNQRSNSKFPSNQNKMFGSLMGDGDDMFGHMRRMNNMMNSFFGNAFGNDMFGGGGPGFPARSPSMALMPFDNPTGGLLSPFPFPNMNHFMRNLNQMPNDPNCHSFSSSSVMSMTTGPDGKPQVYRASSSTRSAPGGVRETKKTVCDSRTGVKKMAIGHHIGDRSHVKEKERNMYSGEVEENEEYVNLDEEEAPEFNREWQNRTRQFASPSAQNSIRYYHQPNHPSDMRQQYLALPPAPSAHREDQRGKSPQKKRIQRSQPYNKRKEKKVENRE